MNKFTKPLLLGALTLSLAGVAVPALNVVSVNADTTSTAPNNPQVNNQLDQSTVQNFDQYVNVENNQYVLRIPDNVHVSNHQLESVQYNIDQANKNVKENNLVIDQDSKTSIKPATDSSSPFVSFAAYHSYFTFRNFWWGTRYYFTSNAAVNQFVWDFTNKSIVLGAMGAAGSLGGVVPGIIGAAGAAYFAKVANDVNYYNQCHIHNQIYLDMNYSLGYSCHILA